MPWQPIRGCGGCQPRSQTEPRRRNPLCRYPTAVCISVWHFGLTRSKPPKKRALNSPGPLPQGGRLRRVAFWTYPAQTAEDESVERPWAAVEAVLRAAIWASTGRAFGPILL